MSRSKKRFAYMKDRYSKKVFPWLLTRFDSASSKSFWSSSDVTKSSASVSSHKFLSSDDFHSSLADATLVNSDSWAVEALRFTSAKRKQVRAFGTTQEATLLNGWTLILRYWNLFHFINFASTKKEEDRHGATKTLNMTRLNLPNVTKSRSQDTHTV